MLRVLKHIGHNAHCKALSLYSLGGPEEGASHPLAPLVQALFSWCLFGVSCPQRGIAPALQEGVIIEAGEDVG